jgi:hypothetical protein
MIYSFLEGFLNLKPGTLSRQPKQEPEPELPRRWKAEAMGLEFTFERVDEPIRIYDEEW